MLSFLAVFLLLVNAKELTSLSNAQYLSVGYLPNWSYSAYTNTDFTALTHINIAFCNPNSSGDINCGIGSSDLKAIVNKAHQNGVKVMASLGGAGGSAHFTDLSGESKRGAFSQKIVDYCLANGLDGVDLDIEGEVENGFWNNYEHFVWDLNDICPKNGLLLTTAVGQWYADKITTYTFTLFDFVTIMEYDLYANNYQGRIDYFLNRGIPANKLVLGVPFYGEKNGNEVAYKQIISENANAWQTSSWNGYKYHNPQDIADIATLSKRYYGVMHWELSQDLPTSNAHSLLKAIKDTLF